MKEEKIKKIEKYIVFFYVYAFLGWIVDVLVCFIGGTLVDGHGILENRGFLYETICPMYGWAALVLILITSKMKKGKGTYIKSFIVATIWCTILEYLTALILETFFGLKWWDYSEVKFNIQGRICLAASIFWGLLSVIFMNVIHPFIVKILKKISSKLKEKTKHILVWTAFGITTIDTIISIIMYLK